jgi:hypothetical protein
MLAAGSGKGRWIVVDNKRGIIIVCPRNVRTTSCILLIWFLVASACVQSPVQAPTTSPPRIPSHEPDRDLLDLCGELTHRTILSTLRPRFDATLPPELLRDTNRALTFIETQFAKQGYEPVEDGEKFTCLLRTGWRNLPIADLVKPPQSQEKEIAGITAEWRYAESGMVLDFYSDLTHTTVLRPPNLPGAPIRLHTQQKLTRTEMIHAITFLLALNGIAVIPDGKKFTQAVMLTQVSQVRTNAPKTGKGESLIDPKSIPIFIHSTRTTRNVTPKPPTPVQQAINTVEQVYTNVRTRLLGPPASPPKPEVGSLVSYYATLTDTKVIPSKAFDKYPVLFEIKTPVTKAELLYAIETTLAQSGLAIVRTNENSVQVMPIQEVRNISADTSALKH